MASFLQLLYSNIPTSEGCDMLGWRLHKSREFDVRSFYKALLLVICISLGRVFSVLRPLGWFCVWTMASGRILTCDKVVLYMSM